MPQCICGCSRRTSSKKVFLKLWGSPPATRPVLWLQQHLFVTFCNCLLTQGDERTVNVVRWKRDRGLRARAVLGRGCSAEPGLRAATRFLDRDCAVHTVKFSQYVPGARRVRYGGASVAALAALSTGLLVAAAGSAQATATVVPLGTG